MCLARYSTHLLPPAEKQRSAFPLSAEERKPCSPGRQPRERKRARPTASFSGQANPRTGSPGSTLLLPGEKSSPRKPRPLGSMAGGAPRREGGLWFFCSKWKPPLQASNLPAGIECALHCGWSCCIIRAPLGASAGGRLPGSMIQAQEPGAPLGLVERVLGGLFQTGPRPTALISALPCPEQLLPMQPGVRPATACSARLT